jgi:lysophospholipase L1-like esterase
MTAAYPGIACGMTLRLAVLGDSIGAGQGASRPRDALCARLKRGLDAHGFETNGHVFAVGGARSSDLRAQVDRAVPWAPDVAVVVIGANDLSHRTPADQAAGDLGDAVRRLRQSGAEVVVAPAPDLSSVPHVPLTLRPLVQAASMLLRERQIVATTTHGGRVADPEGVTASAFAEDPSLFSSDQFHPSSAGYAHIAAALLPTVLAAAIASLRKPGRPAAWAGDPFPGDLFETDPDPDPEPEGARHE